MKKQTLNHHHRRRLITKQWPRTIGTTYRPSLQELRDAVNTLSVEQFEQVFANLLDLDMTRREKAFLGLAQCIFRVEGPLEQSLEELIWANGHYILSGVVTDREQSYRDEQEFALTEI